MGSICLSLLFKLDERYWMKTFENYDFSSQVFKFFCTTHKKKKSNFFLFFFFFMNSIGLCFIGCINLVFFVANFKRMNTEYASLDYAPPPIYAGSLKYADFENFHRSSKKYFFIFFLKNVFLYINRTL